MKHVLFVGGYANSGKSRSIQYLKNNYDCTVLSTSVVINKMAWDLFGLIFNMCPVGAEKNAQYSGTIGEVGLRFSFNYRDFKIHLAEQIIKKYLGQTAFCHSIVEQITENRDGFEDSLYIVETIGGEEHDYIEEELFRCMYSDALQSINIRSKDEQPGVDIRELLVNSTDITNTGDDYDLHDKLDQFMIDSGYSSFKKQQTIIG